MKVLMINSVCGIRSTGRICTDIAEVLEKEGHDCKIAYGRETVPDKYKKYAVKIGTNFGVKLHAGLSRIFDRSGFYSKHATKKFIKWVKEYKPDIIHLHNLHGYFINIEILFDYLKKANVPVIWTLHDCWAFTGHAAYCEAVACENWKTGCNRCPQKMKYPSALLFDNSKSNYFRKKKNFTGVANLIIVTPSAWLAGLVKQSFLKDYFVRVIHNGIDLSVFKPTLSDFRERYGLIDKKIILGVASVWEERKGLNDFIKLSGAINEDYRIVLVGVSKEQFKILPANIIGIERTNSSQELVEIYTAADVFLNLTYEDNYPTVNLEAQACGTPVITYRTGGSIENVSEWNIVEKGELRLLLEKIYVIIKENLNSTNTNVEIFDLNNMVSGYTNLYVELLKDSCCGNVD